MIPPKTLATNEDGTLNVEYPKFRLREIRDQRGVTQAELAKIIGVSCGYLSQLEGGYRRVNSDLLFNIVCALNVTLGELYEPMGSIMSELMSAFRELPHPRQEAVLKFAQEQIKEHKEDCVLHPEPA
jgi:transcriptional regulator with XRE-family HTH domain